MRRWILGNPPEGDHRKYLIDKFGPMLRQQCEEIYCDDNRCDSEDLTSAGAANILRGAFLDVSRKYAYMCKSVHT